MIYIYGNLNDNSYKTCNELEDKLQKLIGNNPLDKHFHLGFCRLFFDGFNFFKQLLNYSVHTVFYIDINRPYEYTNKNINLHYFPGFDNLILHDYTKYFKCIYLPKAKMKFSNNKLEEYDFLGKTNRKEFNIKYDFKKSITIGMNTYLYCKNVYPNEEIVLVNFLGTKTKLSKNNYCKDIKIHDIEKEHRIFELEGVRKILL